MIFEFCKGKTKCTKCKVEMRKDDIRAVYGQGYYNDPYQYACLDCSVKGEFSISKLIKILREDVKKIEKKINALQALRSQI